MKNIFIGDIHGRDVWKKIIKKHDDIDNIVFIGDYLDSFDITPIMQLQNLIDIIEFKKNKESTSRTKVHLLLGNHDIHYWRNIQGKGKTSGFQPTMSYQYENVLMENEKFFKIVVLLGNRLCTHAGVSSVFLHDIGFYLNDEKRKYNDIPEYLNDLFKYKPNEFIFSSPYNRGYMYLDDYGDDVFQSPIWIRPKSLQKSNKNSGLKKDCVQIIGHTHVDKIDIKGKSSGGKYYFIDCLGKGFYLIENDNVFITDGVNKDKD
jgi:predicted phosphodiesterase